jgi:hypothetical protein
VPVLAAVETHFSAALQAALPGLSVLTGPAIAVPVGASLQVHASRLGFTGAIGNTDDERGASRLFTLHSWPADGLVRQFTLPAGDLEVAEVEAPPGFPRVRGDDYRISAGKLEFQRAPSLGVRALLLGAPARGFIERRRCELSLRLCARDPVDLDALATAALAAALRTCVDLPDLEAAAAAGVRMRLRRPVATLVSVERRAEPDGQSERARCDIELLLRGEAELTVAVGVPDPVGRIAQVEPGNIDVEG